MLPVSFSALMQRAGDYILAYSHHFVAARSYMNGKLEVNMTCRTHAWQSLHVGRRLAGPAVSWCQAQEIMTLDPTHLDAIFRVADLPRAQSVRCADLECHACSDDIGKAITSDAVVFSDYTGGKSLDVCFQDMVRAWYDAQFEISHTVAHPQPLQYQAPLREFMETDSDDESDEGFWDLRTDWLERAQERLRGVASGSVLVDEALDCSGGALPMELFEVLPSFFFSCRYLRALACVCRCGLRAACNRELWRAKTVSLNTEEFKDPSLLRAVMQACLFARSVVVNVRQLASLQVIPQNICLEWEASVSEERRTQNTAVVGFQSRRPLMGAATFDLIVPPDAVTLCVGVQEWRGERRVCCFIDHLFQEDTCIYFMLGDLLGQPPAGRFRCPLQPGQTHRFGLRWHQRGLEVSVDESRVALARLRSNVPNSVSPFAQTFAQLHLRSSSSKRMAIFRPVPSSVSMNARIPCALCQRDYGLAVPPQEWAICPLCDAWVCARHVLRSPTRRCPCCPNQLMDYVGGSGAMNYDFYRAHEPAEADPKFVYVVAKIFRQHSDLFREMPLAAELLPSPSDRVDMSKRVWERAMYRARAILDFVDRKMDLLLFRFLHAEAEHLSPPCELVLRDLPHPSDFEEAAQWRTLAVEHALELQLLLTTADKSRSRRRAAENAVLDTASTAGGIQHVASALAPSPPLLWHQQSGGSLPHEAVMELAKYFFSFEFLRALGLCSAAMLQHVRMAELWEGQLVDMVSPEFMYHKHTVRQAASLCRMARGIILNQPQLACLPSIPLSALVRWEVEPLPSRHANSFGFTSSHSLLGTANFFLKMSAQVRSVTIGVRSPDGHGTVYCKICEAFTDRMCAYFGVSGEHGEDYSQTHVLAADFLRPAEENEVALLWTEHFFSVRVNRRLLGTVRLSAATLSGPDLQSRIIVWAVNPKRITRKPDILLRAIPSPVLATGKLRCGVCQDDHVLRAWRWCVCPGCLTWVCARHVDQSSTTPCPHCHLRFTDYAGGALRPYSSRGDGSPLERSADHISPEAWVRLSSSRASAIRKHMQRCGQLQVGFHEQWLTGMSPQCCRSYGAKTSQIRLPMPPIGCFMISF